MALHPYKKACSIKSGTGPRWPRGKYENTNGLLRRKWPKQMALGGLKEQGIRDMELRLNMMP